MNYEQKYKEALERAKTKLTNEVAADIFPELKESEDERIRKELICFLETEIPQCNARDKYITWLEKQDEQKPANWFQELEDKLANATPQQLAEWKEKYFKEEPAEWSEDDQSNFNELSSFILETYRTEDASSLITWLNDIKNRVLPQPKQEWSLKEDAFIQVCVNAINDISYFRSEDKEELINWLKSLRPQKQDVMSVDEFRHIVGYLVQDIVANEHMTEAEKQPTKFFVEKYYNQLRPQPHWKPSDEMLEALYRVIPEDVMEKSEDEMLLDKLYQGLKYGKVLSEK